MKIYGYDGKRKFLFGELVNGVLIRRVKREKHYLNIVAGYGVQRKEYDTYRDAIRGIVLIEDDKRKLGISRKDFEEHRKVWTRGFGEQYVVSEKFFSDIPNRNK